MRFTEYTNLITVPELKVLIIALYLYIVQDIYTNVYNVKAILYINIQYNFTCAFKKI